MKSRNFTIGVALSIALLSVQSIADETGKIQSAPAAGTEQEVNIIKNSQVLKKDGIVGDVKFDDVTGNASFKLEKASNESKAACSIGIKMEALSAYGLSFRYKTPSSNLNLKVVVKNKQGGRYTWYIFPLAACEEFKDFKEKIETDADTSEIILDYEPSAAGAAEICDLRIILTGNARLKPVPAKDEFRKLTDEEGKNVISSALYIAEESEFAGREKKQQDASAVNGSCTRIAPDSPPYFAVSWDLGRSFKSGKVIPGLPYVLYVTAKTERKGDAGTAFRTGIYNNYDRRYVVADHRPSTQDVENMKWETYLIGAFIAENGQMGYVGPTANTQNIGGIFVDRFIVVPEPVLTGNFNETLRKHPTGIGFSGSPFNDAWFSLTVEMVPEFDMFYVSSEYPKNIPDSFQGISVEYLKDQSVQKTLAFQLGDCGKSFSDSGRMKMKLSAETALDAELVILPESKTRGILNHISIPVGKNAPPECRLVRLSLISIGSGSYLNGVFASPSIDELKIVDFKSGKVMGINKESLNLIQDKMSSKNIRNLKDGILNK